jgi:hypothetical protein
MTTPTITIHNVATDEIITREMNAEELAQFNAKQDAEIAEKNEQAAKETEKAALLERLGITADEAALLLS